MNERGRTLFEALLVIILGSILLVVAINTFIGNARIAKETALRYELGNIRMAIVLYIVHHRRYPESLNELINREYLLPSGEQKSVAAGGEVIYEAKSVISRPYLEMAAVDKKGNPIDPFGNPYIYDSKSGRVKTSTKNYERW